MSERPRGTIVKTITESVALESGEMENQRIKIRFRAAGDGSFHISVPSYIADFFGDSADKPDGFDGSGDIIAATQGEAHSQFKSLMHRYSRERKNAVRKKVLVISFAANLPGHSQYTSPSPVPEISFAERPALSLSYQILWAINDKLYRVHERPDDLPQMTYMRAMPKAGARGKQGSFILDWTESREEFFAGMVQNMTTLIEAITKMLTGDTEGNIDRLIAAGGLLTIEDQTGERS